MQRHKQLVETHHFYVYGPGDYRLIDAVSTGYRTYSLRGLGGEVLRELEVDGWNDQGGANPAGFRFSKDFVSGPNGVFARRDQAGELRFLYQDHLGTTRLVTDASGAVKGHHAYYPYGDKVPNTGELEPTFGFTGHEEDENGATYYMKGRYYMFPIQRFASVDPGRDGWNLYGYGAANPVKFVDPTGRELKGDIGGNRDIASHCRPCRPQNLSG